MAKVESENFFGVSRKIVPLETLRMLVGVPTDGKLPMPLERLESLITLPLDTLRFLAKPQQKP